MEIAVAEERILIINKKISREEAETVAGSKKLDAFGTLNKMTSLWQKPKDDDFELIYTEVRYEPFWHIKCHAKYVYDRKHKYAWPVSGKEVLTVTVNGTTYSANNGIVTIESMDHCEESEQKELLLDAISGQQQPKLATFLTEANIIVTKDEIHNAIDKNEILVPPEVRTSGVIRELLSKVMKKIDADTVLEENVQLDNVDLYYRPEYAFQYRWKSKQKEGVVVVDAVTGQVTFGEELFKKYLGKMMDADFLFDIGADAAGIFIPGGSIATKVIRKMMKREK